eukprot:TRINITY_DN1577_c0_g1_i1.p1 TRINITY_DN1577_c0_g1~~TRINITY_DN1577_c0_g1_i1.p1  ORF type:complete len:301 (+),score=63.16 TRINITY_DN1577_c0_g1_i1:439-1341(+)
MQSLSLSLHMVHNGTMMQRFPYYLEVISTAYAHSCTHIAQGYRNMAFRVGPALLLMMLGIVMILIVATLTSLWVDPDSAILLVFEKLILGICVYMVGIEEFFRVKMALQLKSDIDLSRETASDHLAYAVTSLGYATAVSVLIFDPFRLLEAGAQRAHGGGDVPFSGSVILVVVHLVVVVLAMPVHALAGHLAGLNAARRLPFGRVGLEAFALRSALEVLGILWVKRLPFRSALMAWLLTYIATVALMMWCIKRAEAQLPQEYLQRVGLLHAFGYGVLPAHDPDQDDSNQVETPSDVRQPV